MCVVTGLAIYPVKSFYRMELQSAMVEKRGLSGDRRWLAVDDNNRFLTQREYGILATIIPKLIGNELVLSCHGHADLRIRNLSSRTRSVQVWNDTVDAIDAGQESTNWLTAVIGVPTHLVYMSDTSIRKTKPEFSEPGDIVSFADGFPLLLASEESLVDLNSRLEVAVPMERFRPNIVISGCPAYLEDNWKRIQIGATVLRCVKPCGRCIVTTTDQETGERMGTEPLTTLTTYRLQDKGAMFGINLTPEVLGEVKIGDEVQFI